MNTVLRRRSFLCRSGVLHLVRHSAKLLGLLARGVALGLNLAVRPAAASAMFGATARWPSLWHPAAVAKRHRCLAFAAKLGTLGKAAAQYDQASKQKGVLLWLHVLIHRRISRVSFAVKNIPG